MTSIIISYPFLPHYRSAIFSKLSKNFDVLFVTTLKDDKNSIKTFVNENFNIYEISNFNLKGFTHQIGLMKTLFFKYDNLIILANPFIITSWIYSFLAKFIFNKNVIFWTHGFKRNDNFHILFLKYIYYKLANFVLVYDEYSVSKSREMGFNNFHSVYNSLDYCKIKKFRDSFSDYSNNKYFLSISRLEAKFEYNKAIESIASLNSLLNRDIKYIIIGDGPQRNFLLEYARKYNVTLEIIPGIYSINRLTPFLLNSYGTVYPGIVGLSLIQSLSFGVFSIISDNLNQMPESEALINFVNGYKFEYNKSDQLTYYMKRLIEDNNTYPISSCYKIIDERYNPNYQFEVIKKVLK